jgi:hypothetical protein
MGYKVASSDGAAIQLTESYLRAGPQLTARALPSSCGLAPSAADVSPTSASAARPGAGDDAASSALGVPRSGGRVGSEPDLLAKAQASAARTLGWLQATLRQNCCVCTLDWD